MPLRASILAACLLLPSAAFAQWVENGRGLCLEPLQQTSPRIISDGSGGAIAVWEDSRNVVVTDRDVFAQRLNASGVSQWTAGGVAMCTALGSQQDYAVVPDGSGGAIVTWRDERNGVDLDVYAQRVNGSGAAQWTLNGVSVATEFADQTIPEITSDGAGGALITWFDRRSSPQADAYAQRINGAGVSLWANDGIAVCALDSVQRNPTAVSDGSGGFIVSWWDSRGGDFDIYAQRLSSTGAKQWLADGVPVCTADGDQILPLTLASSPGTAVIVWEDDRSGVDADVYAQRLAPQGAPMWTADGVPLCVASGHQNSLAVIPDGSGGAIVSWSDERSGPTEDDIYTQHVTSGGIIAWTPNGAKICDEADAQSEAQIASDGAGGAIVVWQDRRTVDDIDIYAQRILAAGYVPIVTAVPAHTPAMRAGDVYPNPVTGAAWLDVELDADAAVQLEVFDVAGRVVRTESLHVLSGPARVVIEGRDQSGKLLPSGVYFCRVRAAGETITRKLVIAR